MDTAAPWIPGGRGLRALARALPDCRGCELWADATRPVPGRGPSSARLVLVGEQPGDQEDQQGEPFVGPAGRLLRAVVAEAGLGIDELFLTNAVKHFRHEGTRGKQRLHKTPAQRHVSACRPWLDAELQRIAPEGVILLGAVAARSVLGPDFKVTEERGRVLRAPDHAGRGPWLLATVHPSAVLRSRDRTRDRALLVADLAVAAEALR